MILQWQQKDIQPSAMREVFVEVPKVKYDEIGGLDDIIQKLKESVEWPIKNPEAFKRIGINPPAGNFIIWSTRYW